MANTAFFALIHDGGIKLTKASRSYERTFNVEPYNEPPYILCWRYAATKPVRVTIEVNGKEALTYTAIPGDRWHTMIETSRGKPDTDDFVLTGGTNTNRFAAKIDAIDFTDGDSIQISDVCVHYLLGDVVVY
jgi:hypothetical protein